MDKVYCLDIWLLGATQKWHYVVTDTELDYFVEKVSSVNGKDTIQLIAMSDEWNREEVTVVFRKDLVAVWQYYEM